MYFFFYYLSLEKDMAQTWIPFTTKDALCQILLKLARWFWRRRFLNFDKVFSLFCYYLSLEKGVALHLNKSNSFFASCELKISLKTALATNTCSYIQWTAAIELIKRS